MTSAPPPPSSRTAAAPSDQAAPNARLRTWYAACAPRERHLLLIAAAVVFGGGLIALADHLASERERLAHSLPAMRLAYLGMEQDSLGLAALRQRPAPAAPPVASLPDTISAAASARGLVVESRRNGEVIEVSGTATLAALVNWVATLQSGHRLRPRRLELQPAAADGRARFEAVFEVSGR